MLLPQMVEKDFGFTIKRQGQYQWCIGHGKMKKLYGIKTGALQKSSAAGGIPVIYRNFFKTSCCFVYEFYYGKQRTIPPSEYTGSQAAALGFPVLVDGRHLVVCFVSCLRGNGLQRTSRGVTSNAIRHRG
jgi:hypothetical protein